MSKNVTSPAPAIKLDLLNNLNRLDMDEIDAHIEQDTELSQKQKIMLKQAIKKQQDQKELTFRPALVSKKKEVAQAPSSRPDSAAVKSRFDKLYSQAMQQKETLTQKQIAGSSKDLASFKPEFISSSTKKTERAQTPEKRDENRFKV